MDSTEKTTEVILKIHELTTATQYGKAKVTAEPAGDLLYAVSVPENGYEEREDSTKVFNVQGIRHLVKGLTVILTVDVDKEDF